MQVLIVPDSFKGTLSAKDAAKAMAQGVLKVFPEAKCLLFPMADGGEGSSEIAGNLVNAQRIELSAIGPEGNEVPSFYYRTSSTAFIELAAASGFAQSKNPKESALRATTYGTGQLIKDAIDAGIKDIRLFLGGSATTDAGIGFASALGAKFYNSKAELISIENYNFSSELIKDIKTVDLSPIRDLLKNCKVTAAVDVTNPLCGAKGAAHTYGPQKGLSNIQLLSRDNEIKDLAAIIKTYLAEDFSNTPGAGAAGGAGFGVLALLSGTLVPGAAFFLDNINFNSLIQSSDLVLTGEGRADLQSVQGKLIGEIAERTKGKKVQAYCLCGKIELNAEKPEILQHIHFAEMYSTDSMQKAFIRLEELTAQTLRKE